MDTSSSRLCRVIWTDVVSGTEHFVFDMNKPIELRFGLQFDPSFWSSFESSQFFAFFGVYVFGSVLNRHQQDGDTMTLQGAGSTELWLGLSLGRASQAVDSSGFSPTGIFQFRPQVWFQRQGTDPASGIGINLPAEFAAAPEDHSFMIDPFLGFGEDSGFSSEQLVGGPGRPDS